MTNTLGTLYGISVGPGDPELITLKGLKTLQASPVVAFPQGLHQQPGIAQRIITPWLTPQQILLPLEFPYVHEENTLQTAWELAAQQVWPYLAQGKDVAFACEGDVSFYSTFTYLAQTLQRLYPQAIIERIAGVSSPLAAAAALGQPLTLREQRLLVLPTLYHLDQLEIALTQADVLVLMKVGSCYEQVWSLLADRHLLDRAYGVEKVTWPDQQLLYPLSQYRDRPLSYFSLIIISSNPVTPL